MVDSESPKEGRPIGLGVSFSPVFAGESNVLVTQNANGTWRMEFPLLPCKLDARHCPFADIAVPQNMLAPIAAVLVQWGQFEASLDQVHNALIIFNRSIQPTSRLGFSKRLSRCIGEAQKAFREDAGSINRFKELVISAARHHETRNRLAHGHLKAVITVAPIVGSDPVASVLLCAEAEDGQRSLLTNADLELAYFELGNVTATLSDLLTVIRSRLSADSSDSDK